MDLNTTYMGLKLRSPLIIGAAAPLTEELDNLKRLEDAGAAAIVLHSLFEEQLEVDMFAIHHHMEYGTYSFAEALTYFPEPEIFHVGPTLYLEHIQQAKQSLDIPIIASLNGFTLGGWIDCAREIERAGADAIELNIYSIPADIDIDSEEIETQYIDIVRAVRDEVTIPIAVKLSPYFTSIGHFAKSLSYAGANGLVLFNRFYQPDLDIEALTVRPNLILSHPENMRLPMRWIAILYNRINVDFAATSGIQKGTDVVRMLMVGAKVTAIVGALMRHGIDRLKEIEQELIQWMEENEYFSVKELQGCMSQFNCPDPSEFERVQYMKAIQNYKPLNL
jgi:dihydroorotate dehydrogenase (fumarate)